LRIRSTVRFFLLAASWLLLDPGFAGTREKMQPRAMRFGGSVQLDENLHALLLGIVGPPEFFRNLHSVDSLRGATFQNEQGQVQFFPERMTITLRILGPVAANGKSLPSRKLNHDLMEGLQFKVQWKRGMKMRSVKEFRLLAVSESNFADLDNFGLPIDGWTYEMVLEDSEVPVTDHLILYISSQQDKLLARMSAYL
jgi:hypothetical protein